VPYYTNVKIELFDFFDERFWFGYVVEVTELPPTPEAIRQAVLTNVATRFDGPSYEQLREWLDEHDDWFYLFETESIYFLSG